MSNKTFMIPVCCVCVVFYAKSENFSNSGFLDIRNSVKTIRYPDYRIRLCSSPDRISFVLSFNVIIHKVLYGTMYSLSNQSHFARIFLRVFWSLSIFRKENAREVFPTVLVQYVHHNKSSIIKCMKVSYVRYTTGL